MSQRLVKVAVVQAASVVLNLEKTTDKLSKLAKEAATNGAKFVLFPEAFLSGYPRLLGFGQTVRSTMKARQNFKRYWESSVEVPGPIVTQLGQIARENQIHMVTGVIERELSTLYCTLVYHSDEGHFLGKHRKVVPTAAERLVWGQGDGSTLPMFDLPIGKLGGLICWENYKYMPLARVAMYNKGIQIYIAPNADDGNGWLHTVQHIALEGRCFVLSCNQYVTKTDYPEDIAADTDWKDHVVCKGGSCIVSPMGELLAGPNYEGEEILYADLDLDDCIRGKYDLDTVGHYSRPDIFTLTVNQRKNDNVILTNKPISFGEQPTTDKSSESGDDKLRGKLNDLTLA